MIFDILLFASLTICSIGIGYRIYLWVKKPIGFYSFENDTEDTSLFQAIFKTIFSLKIFSIMKVLILDVIFQARSLKTNYVRWLMHILIFFGFIALILMHALDSYFTESLFPYYYSTLNPFFFLRSLFGLMVLMGLAIAIYRRYYSKPKRLVNNRSDLIAILLVFSIIFSGILLEGMKITSVSVFQEMVEDYAGLDYDDEDIMALESFWVNDFGLVSSRIHTVDFDLLDLGLEVHEAYCMDCHSPNRSAFLGYTVAKIMKPMAVWLDSLKGVTIFYYFHIFSCFIGLSLIPFTKMFHIVATPISLLSNAAQNDDTPVTNQLAKQVMALDACTHCSTCNLTCSAGQIFETVQNRYILPSEKIKALKKIVRTGKLLQKDIPALLEGLYLCTNCDRCTVVCPSGIDLKTLWISAREFFIQEQSKNNTSSSPLLLSGFSFIRGLHKKKFNAEAYTRPLEKTVSELVPVKDNEMPVQLNRIQEEQSPLIDVPLTDTFSKCFGCQNCSTICPVVAEYDIPEQSLTTLPHQIMYSLGLGLLDMAKESAMIWNCLSCYQCQENCPQNVSVCDILFSLKNKAFISDREPLK